MRPLGRPAALFSAFSRITGRAFANNVLLSCPTLSKAPNYGNVLRRFLVGAPHAPLTKTALLRLCGRYCLTNGLHLCFLLLARLYIAVLRWKLPAALTPEGLSRPEKPLAIIDTFAVLPRIASDRAFADLYLPGLREEADRSGRACVALYRLYGSRNPLVLWRAFTALAKTDGVTEVHLFSGADWLRLVKHLLVYPIALHRLARSLTHYAQDTPEAYIREALIHTAGQCILLGEARRLAAFRLGLWLAAYPGPHTAGRVQANRKGEDTAGTEGPVIFSWYENQTLNKALQRGLAEAEAKTGRHVSVIGAQLFIWPDTLLNNHPDDGEAALGLVPDKVLVNGPFFLPEASAQTYAVGPALRYGDLFSRMEAAPAATAAPAALSEKPLLVLLSYHPDETRRVLELVLPLALSGQELVYKFHPATRPEAFAPWLPSDPQLAEGSLASCLQNAGAVLGSGSGSLAEAAALGVPVLNVEDPAKVHGLGLKYLPEFGEHELWADVTNHYEVTSALARLREFRTRPEYPARLEAFRNLLFTRPTPERIREAFGLE